MKKIRMMIVSGYLIISTGLAFIYGNMSPEQEDKVIVLEENAVIGMPVEDTENELQIFSVVTQTPVKFVSPTNSPVEIMIANKIATPTVEPLPTLSVVATVTPSMPIDIKDEKKGDSKESIEYNGNKIRYFNTSYRMNEEVLDQVVTMI